jgi:hypothetical protein
MRQRLDLRRDDGEASPARAASMVAFKARRFVWAAMLEMTVTTSPMRRLASFKATTLLEAAPVLLPAPRAISAQCLIWRPMSSLTVASSSVAAATV